MERARDSPRSRWRCRSLSSADAPCAPSTCSQMPRSSHSAPIVSRSSNDPVAVEPAVATTAITVRPSLRTLSSTAGSAAASIRQSRDGTTTTLRMPSPISPTARDTA